MASRASIYRHPIHPMIIVFPIGLWVFSFVCDLVALKRPENSVFWNDMAFYTMAAGVVGALAAAIPGFIDYLGLREPRVKRIATTHLVLNLVVIILYVFNLGFRLNQPVETKISAVLISAIAIVLLAISGWLGGSMVYVHGVAVERGSTASDERDQTGRRDRAA
jgi:Predicted membrane protein